MGRYTGPVEKLERREGVALDLKGKRQALGKTALERRGAAPPASTAPAAAGPRASTANSFASRRN